MLEHGTMPVAMLMASKSAWKQWNHSKSRWVEFAVNVSKDLNLFKIVKKNCGHNDLFSGVV